MYNFTFVWIEFLFSPFSGWSVNMWKTRALIQIPEGFHWSLGWNPAFCFLAFNWLLIRVNPLRNKEKKTNSKLFLIYISFFSLLQETKTFSFVCFNDSCCELVMQNRNKHIGLACRQHCIAETPVFIDQIQSWMLFWRLICMGYTTNTCKNCNCCGILLTEFMCLWWC